MPSRILKVFQVRPPETLPMVVWITYITMVSEHIMTTLCWVGESYMNIKSIITDLPQASCREVLAH